MCYSQLKTKIDQTVTDILCRQQGDETLLEAMRYGACGGKRLRGILLMIVAGSGVSPDIPLCVAAALEMMHAYTIIHDDLPVFDNDIIRRGKPTCHVKFGEQIALLAGNALFSTAINAICNIQGIEGNAKAELCSVLTDAFGSSGVMSGQAADVILSRKREINMDDIDKLILRKTAFPFIAASQCGCILANIRERESFFCYAENLGKCYQIIDDISDADDEKPDANIVKLFGMEHTRRYLERLHKEALDALSRVERPKRELGLFLETIMSSV